MDYRVYLLAGDGHIRAAENFTAASHGEATDIATALHDACSDVFPACEVWQGRFVVCKLPLASQRFLPEVRISIDARQKATLDLEDRLQSSFAGVRRCRALMGALDGLKGRQ